jgi:hypothetical protein
MDIGEHGSMHDGHRIRKIDILVQLTIDKICEQFGEATLAI